MGKNNKNKAKEINVSNKKTSYKYISGIILFLILTIFSCILYNKEYYYPKWSNGEKIGVTNGVVINRYVDENTKDVYSCVEYYDNMNNRIEKWFQVDLGSKQNFKIYYVLDNPIEQSRLTMPHNKFLIYTLPILIVLFIFLDIYNILQIIKKQKENKKKK